MILGRAGINKLISKAQDALALALVMHSSRCAIEIVILSDKLKLPGLPPLQIALALSLAIAINFNYKNIVNCWVKEGVIYKCFTREISRYRRALLMDCINIFSEADLEN